MSVNDGGPAFPQIAEMGDIAATSGGMSLRDWFAGKSDIPWNAVMETLALKGNAAPTVLEMATYRAALKYIEADAMLAARGAK